MNIVLGLDRAYFWKIHQIYTIGFIIQEGTIYMFDQS